MKKQLEKLRSHLPVILEEMKKIGYERVYVAEPTRNRPDDELTLLVEAANDDDIPPQPLMDELREKIEKTVGIQSCMVYNKTSLEETIAEGMEIDIKLFKHTLDSAKLLTASEEKLRQGGQKRKEETILQPPSPELSQQSVEKNARKLPTDLFKEKKAKKENPVELILQQLRSNPEVFKILKLNPHILSEVEKQLTHQKEGEVSSISL